MVNTLDTVVTTSLQQSDPLCSSMFDNLMTTWDLTRHVTRTYSFVVLSVQSLLLVYLVVYIYRQRRHKITLFTALMLTTIGTGLVLGITEAIIFILATNSDASSNTHAENFIFYGCGYWILLLSEIQNYVQWLSALILAHKYHVVALTIDYIMKTGNFLTTSIQRNIYILYLGLILACATYILIEESLIWSYTVNRNPTSKSKASLSFSILTIFFLTILILLFAYSYVKITRTLKTAQLDMSINKKMMTVNFCLLLTILLTWIIQVLLYG